MGLGVADYKSRASVLLTANRREEIIMFNRDNLCGPGRLCDNRYRDGPVEITRFLVLRSQADLFNFCTAGNQFLESTASYAITCTPRCRRTTRFVYA